MALTFYRPMVYIAKYKDDGKTVDTNSVIALNPTRFTSDGITFSAKPKTYDDETPGGTFTYDLGTTEGNSFSGTIKFADMAELAALANNGEVAGDKKNGQLQFGNPNACAKVTDRAVVMVDLCDPINATKMFKADHCHMSLMTDDLTLGGDDPFAIPFTIYAHPGENESAIFFGTKNGQTFDPTSWTLKNAPQQ